MDTKIKFPALSVAQCHVIFNMAFEDYMVYYDIDDFGSKEPEIKADNLHLILTTDQYQLIVKQSGEVTGGIDETGEASEYSECEVDGRQIRKMLRQYNVDIYTEADFIGWLQTQRNYDQSPRDNFFGTYLMGVHHFVTVYRKTEQEPYTYILHGMRHSPQREFCRTTNYDKFLESLDKVNAMSVDEQESVFDS